MDSAAPPVVALTPGTYIDPGDCEALFATSEKSSAAYIVSSPLTEGIENERAVLP